MSGALKLPDERDTFNAHARRFGYGVVRDFTGHGIGTAFHSGLVVPHYDSAPAHCARFRAG